MPLFIKPHSDRLDIRRVNHHQERRGTICRIAANHRKDSTLDDAIENIGINSNIGTFTNNGIIAIELEGITKTTIGQLLDTLRSSDDQLGNLGFSGDLVVGHGDYSGVRCLDRYIISDRET